MITSVIPSFTLAEKARRLGLPEPPEDDNPTIDDAIPWLLDTAHAICPSRVTTCEFKGGAGRWTWVLNGGPEWAPLDPPLLPPPGVPENGSRVRAVLPRHIFIFLNDAFVGYFNERNGGFGVAGVKLPTVFDMLRDLDKAGMDHVLRQIENGALRNEA